MSVNLVNTRVDDGEWSYSHAIIEGLGAEGGLFTPRLDELPGLSSDEFGDVSRLKDSYEANTARLIGRFADIPEPELLAMATDAYHPTSFDRDPERSGGHVVPVSRIARGIYLAELYHGPTRAFKDLGLQITTRQMDSVLGRNDSLLTIAGATSGDTGSAAIDAVLGTQHMNIVMLSPPHMTAVQKGQMGKLTGERALNLTVDGTFDDCQDLVKLLNKQPGFEDLGALNSINWGRIVGQVPYYFSSYFQAIEQEGKSPGDQVDFIVPSGNFGNVLAGFVAKRMGLPIRHLVIATNENDVLHETVETGRYRPRPSERVVETDSPSMDIAKASNFERLAFWMLGDDPEKTAAFIKYATMPGMGGANLSTYMGTRRHQSPLLQGTYGFRAHATTENDRRDAIRATHKQTGQVIDTHTATALHAAYARYEEAEAGIPQVCLATADWPKTEDAVAAALGRESLPERHASLVGIERYADRFEQIPNDIDALMTAVTAFRSH